MFICIQISDYYKIIGLKSATFCIYLSFQVDIPEIMTEIIIIIHTHTHIYYYHYYYVGVNVIICKSENSMNVCGCVQKRDKSKGSKVTTVKK